MGGSSFLAVDFKGHQTTHAPKRKDPYLVYAIGLCFLEPLQRTPFFQWMHKAGLRELRGDDQCVPKPQAKLQPKTNQLAGPFGWFFRQTQRKPTSLGGASPQEKQTENGVGPAASRCLAGLLAETGLPVQPLPLQSPLPQFKIDEGDIRDIGAAMVGTARSCIRVSMAPASQ